jgi:hypothetical protein
MDWHFAGVLVGDAGTVILIACLAANRVRSFRTGGRWPDWVTSLIVMVCAGMMLTGEFMRGEDGFWMWLIFGFMILSVVILAVDVITAVREYCETRGLALVEEYDVNDFEP